MERQLGRLPEEFRQRTKQFASATIRLFVKLPKNHDEVRIVGKQIRRAGTSLAAHVRETSRARSRAEFISILGGEIEEVDETVLCLELLGEDCGIPLERTTPLES